MPSSEKISGRRAFLLLGASTLVARVPFSDVVARIPSSPRKDLYVTIEKFSSTGKSEGSERVPKILRSDEDWRGQLSPESYRVTRRDGTERPYSGKYARHHGDGLYRCICCDTALFDSKTKFESGTGWPSFWKPISELNIAKSADYSLGMRRDEITCRRCDAHLGHVFNDGPKPTGLRYCMNSVALRFVART